MIILALSTAAMLVVASFTGRALAKARERYSVEFVPPTKAFHTVNRVNAVLRNARRWTAEDTRLVDLMSFDVMAAGTPRSSN